MRIALSGSSGTGKTEVAKALKAAINRPVGKEKYKIIEEGVREWLAKNGMKSPKELTKEQGWLMQQQILAAKINEETFLENYIADRSTLDNAAYGLYWHARSAPEEDFAEYIKTCISHASLAYDVIFLFPFGLFDIEDDGCRSTNKNYQYAMHIMISGLVTQLGSYSWFWVLRGLSVEDRVLEIISVMNDFAGPGRGVNVSQEVVEAICRD